MTKLTEPQAHKAAHHMRTAGSFATAISDAYFAADSTNKALLLSAFAPLFARNVQGLAPEPTPTQTEPPAGCSRAIAWQTGRAYKVFGQRIAALMLPNSRVLFVDIDRGIQGVSAYTTQAPLTINLVMSCYDHGTFTDVTETQDYGKEVEYLREQARHVAHDFGQHN